MSEDTPEYESAMEKYWKERKRRELKEEELRPKVNFVYKFQDDSVASRIQREVEVWKFIRGEK